LGISEKTVTSPNTIFTLRDIRPSVRQKIEVDSTRDFSSREANSAGHIPLPNRIAAAPPGLKVVGRREYNNVIGNQPNP
jgi:hypothetical protein